MENYGTKVIGYAHANTAIQAYCDRNLHGEKHWTYYGPKVRRGLVELTLRGEKRLAEFREVSGRLEELRIFGGEQA